MALRATLKDERKAERFIYQNFIRNVLSQPRNIKSGIKSVNFDQSKLYLEHGRPYL